MSVSYTIYNSQGTVTSFYEHQRCEFKILDKKIEGDVLEGIFIPIYLQGELKNKSFLSYPPDKENSLLFSIAFRKVIFENELVKHGFILKEESPDPQALKV